MKKTALFVVCLLLPAYSAHARPPSGFHEGPYFMLEGGLLNFSADTNVRTNTKVGHDYEPAAGFTFGWNLVDWIAPEFEVKYTTNKNGGNREHVVNVGMNAVLYLITDQMTDFKSIHILPFVLAGPVFQFAAVPGDAASSDKTMSAWGPGFGAGAGIRMLFAKYGYAGITVRSDFVLLPDKSQNIGGATAKIMDGGFDVQLGLMGYIGVHF